VDARPEKQYVTGHLPGSINIFPKDLPNRLNELPADKGVMLIFYCGGPTCPYTGQSIEIAAKAGHTNLKGFQAGIPAWKKAGKPVVASPSWVAAGLGPNTVVIDVRAKAESAKGHVKGAVAMEAAEFPAMTQKFVAEKQVARLPGVADMAAPIVVYGDTENGQDVLTAYGELKKYQYKNAAILKGGYPEWVKQGLPIEAGAATTQISYVKKLKPGAVSRDEFAKLVENRGDTILVDVREDKEVAGGSAAHPHRPPAGRPLRPGEGQARHHLLQQRHSLGDGVRLPEEERLREGPLPERVTGDQGRWQLRPRVNDINLS